MQSQDSGRASTRQSRGTRAIRSTLHGGEATTGCRQRIALTSSAETSRWLASPPGCARAGAAEWWCSWGRALRRPPASPTSALRGACGRSKPPRTSSRGRDFWLSRRPSGARPSSSSRAGSRRRSTSCLPNSVSATCLCEHTRRTSTAWRRLRGFRARWSSSAMARCAGQSAAETQVIGPWQPRTSWRTRNGPTQAAPRGRRLAVQSAGS
mmetsp:Transcript_94545/g.282322  ORF Transcript_94545/g.282322 Transcript_94545/m.282322 type:complete len:210 (-) Transcript_94545:373-1002(-)